MGIVPNHTKLLKEDGSIANSKERQDCLADYFEKKQLGINHDRNKIVRTTNLFYYMSDIDVGKISRTTRAPDLMEYQWNSLTC